MRYAALRFILPVVPVLMVSACTDPVTTDASMLQVSSHAVLACDLTSVMTSDVRSYFSQPERRTAQAKMRQLESACLAGDAALTDTYAYELLATIETVVTDGLGGDAIIGSRLVNALLACTTELGCTADALPGLQLVAPMSNPEGLFAVYVGKAGDAAIARGGISFVSEDEFGSPVQNSALFGAELSDEYSWTEANGTDIVLIYGQQVTQGGPNLQEISIGDLVYDVSRWPSENPFVDDDVVHVGVCFAEEVVLPHDETAVATEGRMQRESMLLSYYSPKFCSSGGSTQLASVFGSVAALTKSLLRTSGLMAMTDKKIAIIGGSAIDFSHFAPVGADTKGSLDLLTEPPAVVSKGDPLGPIKVEARSGNGTLMERVFVELYIAGNNGVPAGAVLLNNEGGYTSEEDGTVVIDGVSIDKTGAYTVCARGELNGFTFEDACTTFNIKP